MDQSDRRDNDEPVLNNLEPPGAAKSTDDPMRAVSEVGSEFFNGLPNGAPPVSKGLTPWRVGESEGRPPNDARGVVVMGLGGSGLCGSGNSGPLSFFRRARRKKVVVVDTVCVVVV